MNAIEHGNRGDPSLDVEVVVRRTAESVTVDIADFGRGRPAGDRADPDIELKIAGLQNPRGWGLFLVRQLTDRVDEIADGDRHLVRLVMHTAPTKDGDPS
jgi:anti-sigma regulatory factor (Ser/Thr protein kinase)